MGQHKLKLSLGAAILLILSLALALIFSVTQFYPAFSFPWIAWTVLGFGAVATLGRGLITVRDPSDGPVAGKIESAVNKAIAIILLSMPALFLVSTVVLTLLFASVETFGLLMTVASVLILYAVVKYALSLEKPPAE
jgi:hypothetical protein